MKDVQSQFEATVFPKIFDKELAHLNYTVANESLHWSNFDKL